MCEMQNLHPLILPCKLIQNRTCLICAAVIYKDELESPALCPLPSALYPLLCHLSDPSVELVQGVSLVVAGNDQGDQFNLHFLNSSSGVLKWNFGTGAEILFSALRVLQVICYDFEIFVCLDMAGGQS